MSTKLIIKRRNVFLLCGFVSGFLWIFPVFREPSESFLAGNEISFLQRAMRSLAPALVIFVTAWRRPRNLVYDPIVLCLFFALVVSPLITFFSFPYGDLALVMCGPVILSGIVCIALATVPADEFYSWLFGFSFVACMFLLAGLARYGITPSSFYGRPRAHMGFVHPTQTGAVILAASFILFQLRKHMKGRIAILSKLSIVTFSVVAFGLLVLADSRNTYLALLIFALGWLVMKNKNIHRFLVGSRLRLNSVAALCALAPLSMYAVGEMLEENSPSYRILNKLSSDRVKIFRTFLSDVSGSPVYRLLIGPTDPTMHASEGKKGLQSLSVVDSVYLSYFSDFGLMHLTFLLLTFWLLYRQLILRQKALGFGALLGCSTFYLFDSQGLTVSNLPIFTFLVIALREGVGHHNVQTAFGTGKFRFADISLPQPQPK